VAHHQTETVTGKASTQAAVPRLRTSAIESLRGHVARVLTCAGSSEEQAGEHPDLDSANEPVRVCQLTMRLDDSPPSSRR